jgi:hypothetical protein
MRELASELRRWLVSQGVSPELAVTPPALDMTRQSQPSIPRLAAAAAPNGPGDALSARREQSTERIVPPHVAGKRRRSWSPLLLTGLLLAGAGLLWIGGPSARAEQANVARRVTATPAVRAVVGAPERAAVAAAVALPIGTDSTSSALEAEPERAAPIPDAGERGPQRRRPVSQKPSSSASRLPF